MLDTDTREKGTGLFSQGIQGRIVAGSGDKYWT
jgi:hypothetical protein